MILFPAIDLKDGLCVRLYQGRFDEQTVYGHNPAEIAEKWADAGAEWLHLVDLDGSLGDSKANLAALEKIVKLGRLKMQLGGGIRSVETAQKWFDLGLDRLIIGTIACTEPELAAKIAQTFPGKIAVALDAADEEVRIRGWRDSGGVNLWDAATQLKAQGAAMVIYTDVERDGTQNGPNLENTRRVAQVSGLPTVCSGGISTIDDLEALKPLAADGVVGAITGRAIYVGTLDFAAGQELLKKR